MFKIGEWQPKRRLTMPPTPKRVSRKAHATQPPPVLGTVPMTALPRAETPLPLTSTLKTSMPKPLPSPASPDTAVADAEVAVLTQPTRLVAGPSCISDAVDQEEAEHDANEAQWEEEIEAVEEMGQLPPWYQQSQSR